MQCRPPTSAGQAACPRELGRVILCALGRALSFRPNGAGVIQILFLFQIQFKYVQTLKIPIKFILCPKIMKPLMLFF
jgi:hypothetical protein